MEIIIVINAGSSSIKFQVFDKSNFNVLASGLLERLYIDGNFEMKINDKTISKKADLYNHEVAVEFLINNLKEYKILTNINDLKGVGHRIVQGGDFSCAQKINDKRLKMIDDLSILAPLHNPGGIAGIKAFQKMAPNAINVTDFDTAFHTTIPEENTTYAIPEKWRNEYGVKRFGAHGISYEYITKQMAKVLNKDINDINLIIAHLGNGASIAAIKNGKSYNTSMGLTPLAGLIMGTRCGDIDPAIANYISFTTGKNIAEITTILNKESGIKALTGYSDMRDIEKAINNGDKKAILGMKLWARQIANYISMYYNQLEGKLDAIVFTAGIGENGVLPRKKIFEELHIVNSKLCDKKNNKKYDKINIISTHDSTIPSYVMRTNEELLIAQKVKKILNSESIEK